MKSLSLTTLFLGILVSIVNCESYQPLLTIAIENQNQIVCQASCQNQCSPKLRIVAQTPYMGNSYGSAITVHTAGKIMVICYLERDNVTFTWIRKSFEAIQSPGLNLYEIGNRRTQSLRSLSPSIYLRKIGLFNSTSEVQCYIRYPSREMQELSLFRVSADGIKSEVSMSAKNVSAYFNYDGSMVTVYYRHYFTYTEDHQNNSFECRATDVYTGKFRVHSSQAYETGVKCSGQLQIHETSAYFLSNESAFDKQHYTRELQCSCPNANPEPDLYWTTPSGHRIYNKNITIRPNDMTGRYCCHVFQYLASSKINRNEGCLMVGQRTGCNNAPTEAPTTLATRFSSITAHLEHNGLLLVSLDGREYGTVCSHYFDINDVRVVCRMLNLPSQHPEFLNNVQGDFGRKKVLFDLHCGGHENSLAHCAYNLWGSWRGRCSSSVGVICNGTLPNITARLEPNGLLLVSRDGRTFGTVCDDNFDVNDARVVCRMLNLNTNYPRLIMHATGGNGRSIFMDELQCRGTEASLTDCPHFGWGRHDCGHNEDIGVSCEEGYTTETPTTSSSNITARLEPNGLLLVSRDGRTFGTVCDDAFDVNDARVVCRMLNLNTNNPRLIMYATGGNGRSIFMDDLHCLGTEASLEYCPHNGWGRHNCGHSEDIGVSCEEGYATQRYTTYW